MIETARVSCHLVKFASIAAIHCAPFAVMTSPLGVFQLAPQAMHPDLRCLGGRVGPGFVSTHILNRIMLLHI